MSVSHVVAQGEFLSLIAARFGFRDHRVIWDHPDNAALKKLRKNPNVLFPGDVVAIPDRTEGRVAAATGRFNVFAATDDDALLNVAFQDAGAVALAARDGERTVAGTNARGTFLVDGPSPLTPPTDAEGAIRLVFTRVFAGATMPSEVIVRLFAAPTGPEVSFRLIVGGLDPIDTPSGQRARLNNLGYFAGYGVQDQRQLEWAVEEFQADEGLADRGLTGILARDRTTLNRLGIRHGDMVAGEEIT